MKRKLPLVAATAITLSMLSCDASDSLLIVVDDIPQQLTITLDGRTLLGDTLDLEVGQSGHLAIELSDQVGGGGVAWTSSNSSVAGVSNNGVVTALSPGYTEISATQNDLVATLPVVVRNPEPPSLVITPGVVVLSGPGTSRQLTVAVSSSSGGNVTVEDVTWESLDPSVATVSNGGVVTAHSIGTTLLVVTAACCSPAEVPVSVSTTEGVFFSSDWGTATGSSDEAISDGGTWGTMYCSGRNATLSVVPGSSVGFTRTENVLRVQELGEQCGMLEAVNAIPLSTSHYGRMYFRNDETQSRTNHTMTYFPVGRIQTAAWNRSGSPTGVNIRMRTYYDADGSGATYPHAHWLLGDSSGEVELSNGTWYRYEWHMEYLTPTTYRLWPRIYTVDGTTPIYDADDFWGGDYTVRLSDYYAGGGAFGFSDVELARNFGLGNEGPASAIGSGEYWYHAGVVLSTSGWIGN